MPVPIGNILPRVKLAIEGKAVVMSNGKEKRLDPVTHVGGVDVIPLIKAANDMGIAVPQDLQPDPSKPNYYLASPVARLILSLEEGVRQMMGQPRQPVATFDEPESELEIQAENPADSIKKAEESNFLGKPVFPPVQKPRSKPKYIQLMNKAELRKEMKARQMTLKDDETKNSMIARIKAHDAPSSAVTA